MVRLGGRGLVLVIGEGNGGDSRVVVVVVGLMIVKEEREIGV